MENNWKELKELTLSNLQFLEATMELMNALIAYSEKNGIPVPLKIYHLVFESNKLHQSLISDEILQVNESDEDLTAPDLP
jgi:coenzyme F420-reducing hydrogenase alpha subunit